MRFLVETGPAPSGHPEHRPWSEALSSPPALPGAGPGAGPALATGWSGFDALHLVRPGRVLLVDVGCDAASALLFRLLAGAVAAGREAVVIDGGNWIDPYRLGDAARAMGLRRDEVLDAVRLARGFTAHQLQSLVEDVMPRAASDPRVGLVLVAALPEMYLDDDLHPSESKALLTRALETARRVARERDVPVVVSNTTLAPSEARHALRRVLDAGVDDAVGLFAAADGGMRVRVRGVEGALLAQRPLARQQLLETFQKDVSASPPSSSAPLRGSGGAAQEESFFGRPVFDPRLKYAPKRAGELRAKQGQQKDAAMRELRQAVMP